MDQKSDVVPTTKYIGGCFLDIKDVTYIMNIKGGFKDIIMIFN